MTHTPIKAIHYHVNWLAIDKGRIRDELAQLADRGLTHVYLSPAWFRLQPRPYQVDRTAMAALEACYDAAADAGIAAITSVLTAGYAGELELPDWHHSADVMGWLQGRTNAPIYRRGGVVRINGAPRRLQVAHPYRTEAYRAGQHELIRVVMGYFAGHSAARHWLIAPGWSYLSNTSASVAQTWWQEITSLARRVHAGAVLMGQVDGPQLIGHGFDAAMMSREVDMVVVDTAMAILPYRTQRAPLLPLRFLAYVVEGLTQRPTVVAMHPIAYGAGASWQVRDWYGRKVAVPVVTGGMLVDAWMKLIGAWQRDTVAGVVYPIGWHWGDDDDRAVVRDECHDMLGLMVQLDAELRSWQQVGSHREGFDNERYMYAPHRELLRIWREFEVDG